MCRWDTFTFYILYAQSEKKLAPGLELGSIFMKLKVAAEVTH